LYRWAIVEGFPPERLVDLYNEAIELARQRASPKAMVAIADSIADRTMGKPVATVIQAKTKMDDILERLASVEPEAIEGNIITGDPLD
jgi:hypothetical protein